MPNRKQDIVVYFEYLENIKCLNITIKHNKLIKQLCFYKNCVILNSNITYFNNFLIDPSTVSNVKIQHFINKHYFEATLRFKVTKFDEHENVAVISENRNIESIESIKCLNCKNAIIKESQEKFQLLKMPEDDLSELEDNFWCHKHDHSHENNDNHSHGDDGQNTVDINKSRKSILHNTHLVLVNDAHINETKVKISAENTIKCDLCGYSVGYKQLNNYFLWKSDILLNDILNYNIFDTIKEQGRYIIKIHNKPNKKLFIWTISSNMYQSVLDIKPNQNEEDGEEEMTNEFSLTLNRKCIKLMYNYVNSTDELNNNNDLKPWLKDLQVDFLTVSYNHYIFLLDKLVKSTNTLSKTNKFTNNGFFIAIINT